MLGVIVLSSLAVLLFCVGSFATAHEDAFGKKSVIPILICGVVGVLLLAISGGLLYDLARGHLAVPHQALNKGNVYEVLGEPVQRDNEYFCFLEDEGGEVLAVSLEEKPEGTKLVYGYKNGKLALLPLKTAGVTIKNPLAEKD